MLLTLDDWKADLAKKTSRSFCMMYKALSDESRRIRGTDIYWKIKPKLHMFQELAEYQSQVLGNPKLFWTYVDEDFVGWIATLAKSRGDPNRRQRLQDFCCRDTLPCQCDGV